MRNDRLRQGRAVTHGAVGTEFPHRGPLAAPDRERLLSRELWQQPAPPPPLAAGESLRLWLGSGGLPGAQYHLRHGQRFGPRSWHSGLTFRNALAAAVAGGIAGAAIRIPAVAPIRAAARAGHASRAVTLARGPGRHDADS